MVVVSVRSTYERRVMTYLVLKAAISGIVIMLASEAARYKPSTGGLIASLPLTSVLAAIWLWRDTGDVHKIASLLESTFWFVLPSLSLFLAVPAMLRHGFGFWPSLLLGCVLTMSLYAITAWLLPRLGVEL
jgi:F0F1-type ATP synthase assembly protein I